MIHLLSKKRDFDHDTFAFRRESTSMRINSMSKDFFLGGY